MAAGQPRVPADVHWRRFDSELVVLDLRKGEYYAFSEVAGRIFEGIARGEPIEDIEQALIQAYDVAVDIVHQDVDRLVGQLLRAGLLEGPT